MGTYLKRRYKSPFLAYNVHHRNEPDATDTVYSDTPAIDSGITAAQFFVGTESMVCDVYPLKSDKLLLLSCKTILKDMEPCPS